VGTFYEALLIDLMHEIMRTRLQVGTGFVFDVERLKPSRQLDLIVYDCTDPRATLSQSRIRCRFHLKSSGPPPIRRRVLCESRLIY
jgi:hypothetical protein